MNIYRKAGRCANGAERDGGNIYHAVPKLSWVALCGDKPGRHSGGWGNEGVVEGGPTAPTCPACVRLLDAVERMRAAGGVIERWEGGFWTTPGMAFQSRPYQGGSYRSPEWSITNGALVLRALAKRGFVVPSKYGAPGFVVEYKLSEGI